MDGDYQQKSVITNNRLDSSWLVHVACNRNVSYLSSNIRLKQALHKRVNIYFDEDKSTDHETTYAVQKGDWLMII